MTSGSNHEQLYSLLLDGDSDYLQLQNNFSSAKITVSVWYFNTTDSGTKAIFENRNEGVPDGDDDLNRGILIYHSSDEKFIVKCQGVATGGPIMPVNQWVHGCMTYDPSLGSQNLKVYVDGVLRSTANVTIAHDNTVWGNARIGRGNISDYYFPGSIDDVAVWDEVLDGDAVEAVYNSSKPFDLNYDRGNYDNSSDLVGYWRMGNGPFDDKVNGVVHDAHNPGFGDELVNDGNFDTDTAASTTGTYWTTGAGWTISGGTANFNTTGNSTLIQNLSITSGKSYRIQISGAITSGRLKISAGSGLGDDSTFGLPLDLYYTHDGGTDDIQIRTIGSSVGYLDNISVKQLNGYPGLTSGTATFSTNTPDD